MTDTCDVFCFGELDVDNFIEVTHVPSAERAAFPTQDLYNVGGAAGNTGIWLANWEVRVRIGGNPIGVDEHGRWIMQWLAEYPTIDARYVEQRDDIKTPLCRCISTPDGERAFMLYWLNVQPTKPLTVEMLRGTRILSLDQSGPKPVRIEAAKLAVQMGVPIVVNDIWELDHPALPGTLALVNSAAALREHHPDIDTRGLAADLHRVSGGIVIKTDGPRETYAIDRDGRAYTIMPPRIKPLDGTGAGDAFKAGVIYGLLQEWPLDQTLRWAVASGALNVERPGATYNPASAHEVDTLARTLTVSPA
ncbi:MAG: carbohydrate kinase family protein [Anaerolineae bacterium]|nr:carbohydrate kinase family protein [Anaerolineae bacterium]